MPENCKRPEMCLLTETCVPCAICPNAKEKAEDRLAPTAGSPSLDTPETNARAAEDKYMECWGEEWSVDADFARKLERERDMARREAEAYRNRWIGDYTIEQTATRLPWESPENTLF